MFDGSIPNEYLSSGPMAGEEALAYATTFGRESSHREELERDLLPPGLEDLPVGPFLAAIVSSVDRERLNGHDAVRLLQAEERLATSFQAGALATMAEVALSPPGCPDSSVERDVAAMQYAAVEIAAALTLTRRAAERRLDLALALHGSLRTVWERFAEGQIALDKVRELAGQLGHLDDDSVVTVLSRTVHSAAALTSGQLRARIARAVMEVDPDGSASSFQAGLADRKVATYPNPDFTANLVLGSLAPTDAAAAMGHIDELARALKGDDETRTLDQIRADVAVDLLKGNCSCGASRPNAGRVVLRAELTTLAGLAETPGSWPATAR